MVSTSPMTMRWATLPPSAPNAAVPTPLSAARPAWPAVCRFGKRQIGLSRPLTELHSEEEVRDTILHEIAHALVGPEHGHDRVWRAKARAIGSSGERCVSLDAPRVVGDWVGTCPAGHTSTRHRAPQRVATCSRCSRRFDLRNLIRWRYQGASVPMPERYAAELRRLLGTSGDRVVAGAPERPRAGS